VIPPVSPRIERAALVVLVLVAFSNRRFMEVAGVWLRADWVGAALALAIVVGLLRQGRRPPWSAALGGLAAFVLAQLVAAVWNRATWPSGLKFGTVYVFAVFYVLAMLLLVRDRATARFALTVVLVVAVVEAAMSAAAVWVSNLLDVGGGLLTSYRDPEGWIKARGFMNEGNIFASLLLVPLALSLWRWGRPVVWSWPPALAAGVLSGTMVFTLTRSAWATSLLIALAWIARVRPSRRQIGFVAVSIAVAGCLLAVSEAARSGDPSRTSGLYRQLVRPFVFRRDPAVRGRMIELRTGYRSYRRQPWIGHGPGSSNAVEQVVAGRMRRQGWIANGAMFVLHDAGRIGLVALVALVVAAAVASRRAAARFGDPAVRRDHEALALGLGGVLLCWQSTNGFWAMYGYLYLGLLLAMHALSREQAAAPAPPASR
jgi:hypothetical protein